MTKDDISLWPEYEFRPDAFYEKRDWLRYADGKWVEDDGEWDRAFITADECGAPIALMFEPHYQRNIIWSFLPGHWQALGPATHPNRNPWHYMLRVGETAWGGDWGRDRHENYLIGRKAMDRLCGMRGCANGRPVEFTLRDPFVQRGLLRRRDTKELVIFPAFFDCMYCGRIELPKEKAQEAAA